MSLSLLAALPLALAVARAAGAPSTEPGLPATAQARALAPLIAWPPLPTGGERAHFIENRGQWPGEVLFAASFPGAVVRVGRDALGLELRAGEEGGRGRLIELAFEDASPRTRVLGRAPKAALHSYFFGSDPGRWIRAAGSYERIVYEGLYAGVDLELGVVAGKLKYDLFIAPGVAASVVQLRVRGGEGAQPTADGGLELGAACAGLTQAPGRSWEVLSDGSTRDVVCRWLPEGDGTLRLEAEGRDLARALVVDPELAWATYFGSSGQDGLGRSALDADGNLLVTLGTNGTDFPTTPGAFNEGKLGYMILGVSKFRGSDGALLYSALYGGSAPAQTAGGLALDSQGRATVCGWTDAADFPTTPGSYDPIKTTPWPMTSGYVLKLSPGGDDLVFSTFLEGPQSGCDPRSILVDANGESIVLGWALGADYPVTSGAFQTTFKGLADSFVTRLTAAGDALIWSTFLGGSSNVDAAASGVLNRQGDLILAGHTGSKDFPTTPGAYKKTMSAFTHTNAFVACLAGTGDALRWCTLLGGSGQLEWDPVVGIALDAAHNVYVAGYTNSPSFPTTPGAYNPDYVQGAYAQSFLTKLTPRGEALVFSTFWGSTYSGVIGSLALDPSGVATVGGSPNVPPRLTPGAYSLTVSGGIDGFVGRMTPEGSRVIYASMLGGSEDDIFYGLALGHPARAFLAGTVFWPGGFPTTPGAFQPGFAGGQGDGLLVALDLYLEGVVSEGDGTPGCLGPLAANVSEMPAPDASQFSLFCSAAPPHASGWLVLGREVSASAVQSGATLLLEPSSIFARLPATAGEAGFAEVTWPLTGLATGDALAAQFVFEGTAACGGPGTTCSSNALRILLQP